MNDEALNTAFARVKEKFKNHHDLKKAFQSVRDEINDVVQGCVNNVKVVIYIDEVLDDPIVVNAGEGDNKLRITIQPGGNVTYSWTYETFSKIFYDAWNGVKEITKNIIKGITSKLREMVSFALSFIPRPALKF